MKTYTLKASAFVSALTFSLSLGLAQINPTKAEALEIYIGHESVQLNDKPVMAQNKKHDPPKVHKYGQKKDLDRQHQNNKRNDPPNKDDRRDQNLNRKAVLPPSQMRPAPDYAGPKSPDQGQPGHKNGGPKDSGKVKPAPSNGGPKDRGKSQAGPNQGGPKDPGKAQAGPNHTGPQGQDNPPKKQPR